MDDHPPTASQNSLRTDAEPVLDAVTEELKVEFARLEQVRRLQTATSELEESISASFDAAKRGNLTRSLSEALENIRRYIDSLQDLAGFIGYTPRLRQKLQFWTVAFKVTRDALAKLNALLAHSLRATLRTPLLLDGPELSGYKHRLR